MENYYYGLLVNDRRNQYMQLVRVSEPELIGNGLEVSTEQGLLVKFRSEWDRRLDDDEVDTADYMAMMNPKPKRYKPVATFLCILPRAEERINYSTAIRNETGLKKFLIQKGSIGEELLQFNNEEGIRFFFDTRNSIRNTFRKLQQTEKERENGESIVDCREAFAYEGDFRSIS